MKKLYYTKIFLVLLFSFFTVSYSFGQDTLTKKPIVPAQQNAGFDVIILKNGDLVYGLVKEVGLTEIKYQRTDIPDGPVYVILRSEVFTISYRNQLKDILNPIETTVFVNASLDSIKEKRVEKVEQQIFLDTSMTYNSPVIKFKQRNVLVGFGFIRGFTKVDNVDDYSSSASFPTLIFAYEYFKNRKIRLGVQAAMGSHKFTKQEFSTYDNAKKDIALKENIFTLHLYGKYSVAGLSGSLRPYLMGGLGIHSSYLRSAFSIAFQNNSNQVVLVKSGSQSVGLGGLLRVGADYKLNENFQLFSDVGIGPSLVQLGISLNIDNFK